MWNFKDMKIKNQLQFSSTPNLSDIIKGGVPPYGFFKPYGGTTKAVRGHPLKFKPYGGTP